MKKKVLITRAREQADEFAEILANSGFEFVIFPTIEFTLPENKSAILKAMDKLKDYHWLILTSANGVRYFIRSLEESGKNRSNLDKTKICAVGPKTAETAIELGLNVDLIPENYAAEGVLEKFGRIGLSGKNVLFPRAEKGREILPEGLKKLGAKVDLVSVYRTVKPKGKRDALHTILKEGIDVITFTSGSTVHNFMAILGPENKKLIAGVKIACISRITADVAATYGVKTDILPEKNTTLSLAEAVKTYFNKFFP